MLTTRRKRQAGKKRLAGVATRAKKVKKQKKTTES
jgi:hypothetical protein